MAAHPRHESRLDELRRALAEAADAAPIVKVCNRAAQLVRDIKLAALRRDLLGAAGEVKLLAERQAGLALADLHLAGGDHKSPCGPRKLRLDRLGISRKQSAHWQLEARLPEDGFASYLEQAASAGKEPTSHGLRRLARLHVESSQVGGENKDPFAAVARGLRSLAGKGRRFACIYVEAPWSPVSSGRKNRCVLDPRLGQLPLLAVAAPLAHVYLKVAPAWLEDGRKLLGAWGFFSQAWLVCTPVVREADDHWQAAAAVLLVGLRAGRGGRRHALPPCIQRDGVLSMECFDTVFRFMERASPPPYLDLFGHSPFSKEWTMVVTGR